MTNRKKKHTAENDENYMTFEILLKNALKIETENEKKKKQWFSKKFLPKCTF